MKNRKTLKKLILGGLLLLTTGSVFAQTQKVHTLQAKNSSGTTTMNSDALIQMDSDNKGLLLPRIALTGANKVAPLTAHTAGMVVYNTANVPASGSGATAIEAVAPGYYYNDGTKWVKIADVNTADVTKDAWVDTQDATVLETANDSIKYMANGYKLFDKNNEGYQYFDTFDNTYKNADLKAKEAYIKEKIITKNIEYAPPTGSAKPFGVILGRSLDVISKGNEAAGVNYMVGSGVNLLVENNLGGAVAATATGMNVNAFHSGAVKSGLVRGILSQAIVEPNGSATLSEGIRALGISYSNQASRRITGSRNIGINRGLGTVTNVIGTLSEAWLDQTNGATTNVFGHNIRVVTKSTSVGQIDRIYGERIDFSVNEATPVTDIYGLYVGNVPTTVTGRRYAIYTNAGEVRFGDNVGIGTSLPPTEKLEVVGNGKFTGTVAAAGILTTSDKRFKQGVTPVTSAMQTVNKLQPVSYTWSALGKKNGGDNKKHIGFIAQEIEKVLPNLVNTDAKGYKSVNYIEVIPVLTKALQEQQKAIKKQQKEIDELKAMVKKLLK